MANNDIKLLQERVNLRVLFAALVIAVVGIFLIYLIYISIGSKERRKRAKEEMEMKGHWSDPDHRQ